MDDAHDPATDATLLRLKRAALTSPRFEYDGQTDEPRPPLRNSTPLLLLMGLGALFLVLLVVGGLVALVLAQPPTADSATRKVDSATPVAFWGGGR